MGFKIDAGQRLFARLGALRHFDYRLFWFSAFVSNLGGWVQTMAQGWLVLEITDSPVWLGLIGFAGGVPYLFFSLLGGLFADRYDRRRLLILCQTAQMVLAFLLAALTATGTVTIAWIAAISFGAGLASALNGPAYQAIVKDLAHEDLTSAIALNSTQFNLARTLGPPLAALMLVFIDMAGCFLINGLSFLAVLAALQRLKLPAPPAAAGALPLWSGLRQAFCYVGRTPPVQWLLMGMVVNNLFATPYLTLMPVFARDVLKVGTTGLGFLTGAIGVGAVVGSIALASGGDRLGRGRVLYLAFLSFSVSVAGFALSPSYALSLALLVVVGASMVAQVAMTNTLLQTQVPDNLRGRVMSMYSLAIMGFFPIGNLQAGLFAGWVGAPLTLAVGAAAVGLYALSAFGRRPAMLLAWNNARIRQAP
ncbi:MAG: MFS transporter [Aphanocapsa lilacina HA4352-LM1]|nr:MFS transporter [Aphanocapsa lilacina HA4352-LM1]